MVIIITLNILTAPVHLLLSLLCVIVTIHNNWITEHALVRLNVFCVVFTATAKRVAPRSGHRTTGQSDRNGLGECVLRRSTHRIRFSQ